MKELLSYIAKNLVQKPDEVDIRERVKEDGQIVFELRVASEDMGKVIGRQGRTAKEIRTLIKSAAIRQGKKAIVEIMD